MDLVAKTHAAVDCRKIYTNQYGYRAMLSPATLEHYTGCYSTYQLVVGRRRG
jgi:hypothetical protein